MSAYELKCSNLLYKHTIKVWQIVRCSGRGDGMSSGRVEWLGFVRDVQVSVLVRMRRELGPLEELSRTSGKVIVELRWARIGSRLVEVVMREALEWRDGCDGASEGCGWKEGRL